MIDPEIITRVNNLASTPAAMGGWLGLPYEKDGCIKFLVKPFRELGIEIEPTAEALRRERWNFKKVKGRPQFGDVAVIEGLPEEPYHVAFMLDHRRAVQSCSATNGVGKIELTRYPWVGLVQRYYRHKNVSV